MAYMYVANVTTKNHLFIYSIPEAKGQRRVEIGSMRSARLPDDMNQAQIDAVIEQHSPYGLASAADAASRANKNNKICLVYSIDRAPPSGVVDQVRQNNRGLLDIEGEVARQLAAVAVNQALDDQKHNPQFSGLETDTKGVRFDVEEQPMRDGVSKSDKDMINERITVSDQTKEVSAPKKGRR